MSSFLLISLPHWLFTRFLIFRGFSRFTCVCVLSTPTDLLSVARSPLLFLCPATVVKVVVRVVAVATAGAVCSSGHHSHWLMYPTTFGVDDQNLHLPEVWQLIPWLPLLIFSQMQGFLVACNIDFGRRENSYVPPKEMGQVNPSTYHQYWPLWFNYYTMVSFGTQQ